MTTDNPAPPAAASAEVWLLAADGAGLWLLEPAPRVSRPASGEGGLDGAVAQLLTAPELGGSVRLVRSTSWRPNDEGVRFSYVAALQVDGEVARTWPQAQRVADLARAAGPTLAGPAVGPAKPRSTDVLLHAVRSLAVLYDDPTAAVAGDLSRNPQVPEFHPTGGDVARVLRELAWGQHLSSLRGIFDSMYRHSEQGEQGNLA